MISFATCWGKWVFQHSTKGRKMANMGKVTKRQVAIRIEIEQCVAVEKKYLRPSDRNKVVAYIRAIEDATRDVVLTPSDYTKIAKEVRENELKRERAK